MEKEKFEIVFKECMKKESNNSTVAIFLKKINAHIRADEYIFLKRWSDDVILFNNKVPIAMIQIKDIKRVQ
jgi:hypothetical protein